MISTEADCRPLTVAVIVCLPALSPAYIIAIAVNLRFLRAVGSDLFCNNGFKPIVISGFLSQCCRHGSFWIFIHLYMDRAYGSFFLGDCRNGLKSVFTIFLEPTALPLLSIILRLMAMALLPGKAH